MSDDLKLYCHLHIEIARLKHQVQNLHKMNSKLREKLDMRRPTTAAEKCCKYYKSGMTGTELARLAGCSKRYANHIIKLYQLS